MPKRRTQTWREQLADDRDLPKVKRLTPAQAQRWGGATLAIPAPREVNALMREVPQGRVTTINELRAAVARTHRAAVGCPVTTGIFSKIAAFAAEEDRAEGEADLTPYWRTLKKDGELNAKYPGGTAAVERQLAAEGHTFVRRGERTFVRDYTAALYSPRTKTK